MIDLLASALLLRQWPQRVQVVGFNPAVAGKPDDRGDAQFGEAAAHRFEGQVEKPSELAVGERTVDVQHIVLSLFEDLMIVVVFSQSFVKA